MHSRPPIVGFLLLLFLCLAAGPAAAQQSEAEKAERALERYQQYLTRKPYHDWAFDKLVEAAVSRNKLEALVEDFQKRFDQDADDLANRVILARLMARTDRREEALKLLETAESQDPALALLLADLHLQMQQPDQASQYLEKAASGTKDRKLLKEIRRKQGESFLALGNREQAAAAFRAFAELEPDNFNTRLEVAINLSRHNLFEEAEQEFQIAQQLAGEDNAKVCRVLAELGRLHERQAKIPEAVAVYESALDRMGRGNWLKRDLMNRILAIHKRSGQMDALLARTRAASEQRPEDVDSREFLARLLQEMDRKQEASEVLAEAVGQFPQDVKLSRQYISALDQLDQVEGVIAEYQRILAEKPEEWELYIELGQVFAREEKLEQAKLQWERTLANRLQDAGLCLRLAELYAYYSMDEEAVSMYRKAISLEPNDISRYGDLATFLASRDRTEEVEALLQQAASLSSGNASRLEQMALLWKENGYPQKALADLEQAVALRPEEARLLSMMVDLLIELDRPQEAVVTLYQVINKTQDQGQRSSSVDRWLRMQDTLDSLETAMRAEQEKVHENSAELAPYLIVGRFFAQSREHQLAMETYQKLIEVHPDQEEAHSRLARLYEDLGDFHLALQQYEKLIQSKPQARRQYLKESARIHLRLFDQEAAFACYEEILQSSPDNPAVFREVADAYQKLNLKDKALQCLQQAARLAPEDGQTFLELAELQMESGEVAKARTSLEAALQSDEERTRDKARKRYYELLLRDGSVEEEMAVLRERVERNPYDLEAPLTLADLYIRELEYELGLEMLDRLLSYQPEQPKLLEERARISLAMERFDEAVNTYERLWKLPKADQQHLALRITEAHLLEGDLQRADEVAKGIGNRNRLARLYSKHKLFDRAIAVLESVAQGSRVNPRTLSRLARMKQDQGDLEGAVVALEQAFAARSNDWRTVKGLGDLYYELGRKEDVLAMGERLFALIREHGAREEEEEEDDQENDVFASFRSFNSSWGRYQNRYRQAVSEIQQFFNSKNMEREFGEIGAREALAQPTNESLYQVVQSHLNYNLKDVELSLSFLDGIWKATVEQGRTPPSYTPRSWRNTLERARVSVFRDKPKQGRQREQELRAEIAAGASIQNYQELCQVLGYLRKDQEILEAFQEGLGRFPDSVHLLAGLASHLLREKRYQEALEPLNQLLPLLENQPEEDEEQARSRRLQYKRRRQELIAGLPSFMQRQVKEGDLQRAFQLEWRRPSALSWQIGSHPKREAALKKHASCLLRLKRAEEAKQSLAALQPEKQDDLQAWISLGNLYFQEDLLDEAAEAYEQVRQLEDQLYADPVLAWFSNWKGSISKPMSNLARIRERQDRYLEAFDLLRSYGKAEPAWLLLSSQELWQQSEDRYGKRLMDAEAQLAELQDSASPEARRLRHQLRDAAIKLAEIHQIQTHWDQALSTYQRILPALSEDFSIPEVVAKLHLRAGRPEKAVDTLLEVIDRKKERNRKPPRDQPPLPRMIQPSPPPLPDGGANDWIWSNLRATWYRPQSQGRFPLKENYVDILRIYLDGGQAFKAAGFMRKLAREDITTFSWLSWTMAQVIQNYEMGKEALPILRMLHNYNPDDADVILEYGKALIEDERFEEAQKVLLPLSLRSRNWWGVEEAEDLLQVVEQKLGLDNQLSLEQLLAKVEEDPKNVRNRIKLANAYIKKDDFTAAREEAEQARKLAPHQSKVKDLYERCLKATGDLPALENFLKEKLKGAKGEEERFQLGIQLARLASAQSKQEEAWQSIRKAAEQSKRYSAVGWLMEQNRIEEAHRLAKQEFEEFRGADQRRMELRNRLRQIELLRGNLKEALDLAYESFDSTSSFGGKAGAFQELVTTLETHPNPAVQQAEVMQAAQLSGGLQGALYRAAFYQACRRWAEQEEALQEALSFDEDALFIYPLLLNAARERQDADAALAYMEDLERINPGSESQTVRTTAGQISERDTFRAEKGSLLFQLDQRELALEVWQEIYDPANSETRKALRQIYQDHRLYDQALAMHLEYLNKEGERNVTDLLTLSELYFKTGQDDLGFQALERARLLAHGKEGDSNRVRNQLQKVHRERNRLEEYYQALADRSQQDPDDVEILREMANLAAELKRPEEAIAALEKIGEKPSMQASIQSELAEHYQRMGDYPKALRALELAWEGNLDDWDRNSMSRTIARLHLRLGDPDKALEAWLRGKAQPDGREAQMEMMNHCLELERYEEAMQYAKKAEQLEPDNPTVLREIGDMLREKGDLEQALVYYFRALSSPKQSNFETYRKEAVLHCESALSQTKIQEAVFSAAKNGEALLWQAALSFYNREWAAAEQSAQSYLETNPDNAVAWDLLQKSLMQQNKGEAAFEIYREFLGVLDLGVARDYFSDWQVRNSVDGYGDLAAKLERWEEAGQIWRSGFPMLNQEVRPWYYYSNNLFPYYPFGRNEVDKWLQRDRLQEALDALEFSVYRGGNSVALQSRYASILGEMGRTQEAEELLWLVLKKQLSNGIPQRNWWRDPFDREKNPSFSRFSDNPMEAMLLLFQKSQDLSRLESEIQQEFAGEKYFYHRNYALCSLYYYQDRGQDAVPILKALQARDPEAEAFPKELAEIHLSQGNHQEALNALQYVRLLEESGTGVTGVQNQPTAIQRNTINFQWSGNLRSFSSRRRFYYGNYRYRQQIASKPMQVALLWSLGRETEAATLEREYFLESSLTSSYPYTQLAKLFLRLDLPDHGLRVLELGMQRLSNRHQGELLNWIIRSHHRGGSEEARNAAWQQRLQQRQQAAKGLTRPSWRLSDARLRMELDWELEQALADLQSYCEEFPTQSSARFSLAALLLRLQKPEEALQAWRQADETRREDSQGRPGATELFTLGLCLQALGRNQEAIPTLQEALRLAPFDSQAGAARKALEGL